MRLGRGWVLCVLLAACACAHTSSANAPYGIVRHCVYGTVWYVIVRYCLLLYGSVRNCAVWYGTILYGTGSIVRCCTVLSDLIRYDEVL